MMMISVFLGRFEVVTAALLKIRVFCYTKLCPWEHIYRRFGGLCHSQGQAICSWTA